MAYQAKYAKPSKGNGAMRLAFVMLCLVMVSVYMMAGLLAKYRTSGTGDDEARVAKFDVKVTGNATDTAINCTQDPDTGGYTIRIENDSEVAVRYTISVAIHPVDSKFSPASIACQLSAQEGTLPVGPDAVEEQTLTFSVVDWEDVTQSMTGESGQVAFTFTVTVHAEQID